MFYEAISLYKSRAAAVSWTEMFAVLHCCFSAVPGSLTEGLLVKRFLFVSW